MTFLFDSITPAKFNIPTDMRYLPHKSESGIARIPNYCGYTVLNAEDMATNRKILSVILTPTMLAIDFAENGFEAVQLFKNNPWKYALIFMDMEMPRMGGCEATRQIRSSELPRCKRIPIIAMTSNVSAEDVDKCLAAGMNAHLAKPYDPEKIIETLRKYIW